MLTLQSAPACTRQCLWLAGTVLLTVGSGALMPQPTAAQTDECDPPRLRGPVEVMPASGASRIPLDHPLRIVFTPGYFSSPAAPALDDAFEVRGPDGKQVLGEVQLATDDVLFFVPSLGWQPDTNYAGTAFGETDLRFNFSTGSVTDARPPTVSALSYRGSTPVDPSCPLPDGGYRVDLEFPVSVDDGAAGSIEYTLYLSRAADLDAPVLLARLRNFTSNPDERVPISFLLEGRFAAQPICVQLIATDGVGNATSGSPSCFDPIEGAKFAGLCSVGRPVRPFHDAPWELAGFAGTIVLLALRKRRRRLPAPTPI